MFNLFRNHRRKRADGRHQAPVASGLSRRLALESMEGRLMLSAASLDFTSLSSHISQLNLQNDNQVVHVSTQVEDGYITFDFSLSGRASDSNSPQSGISLYNDAVQDLVNHNALLQSDTNITWNLFDSADAMSNGIRPVVIVVADGDGSFQNFIGPPLLGNSESSTHWEEGGAIPIESILTQVPALGAEPGKVSTTLISAKSAAASHNIGRLTPSSAMPDVVTGEWARAVAFETAGGEKGAERSATQTGRNNSNSTPIESIRVGSGPLSNSAPNAAATAHGKKAFVAAQELSADGSSGVTNAVLHGPNSLPRDQGMLDILSSFPVVTQIAHLEMADASSEANSASDAAILDFSYAEAFQQLGEQEETANYSLVADYTRRFVGAMPLLTILALERITARNSRRVNKESSAAPLRQPMLSTGPREVNPDSES